MPQVVQTHINALYADLVLAKQDAAAAKGRVEELEAQILVRGGELPGTEVVVPAPTKEDTATFNDTSAAEAKPIEKLNREELDAYALEHGIDNPVSYETKKDLIDAIKVSEGEKV